MKDGSDDGFANASEAPDSISPQRGRRKDIQVFRPPADRRAIYLVAQTHLAIGMNLPSALQRAIDSFAEDKANLEPHWASRLEAFEALANAIRDATPENELHKAFAAAGISLPPLERAILSCSLAELSAANAAAASQVFAALISTLPANA